MSEQTPTTAQLEAIAQAAVDLVSMTDTAPFRPRLTFSVDASVIHDLRQSLVDGDLMVGQVKVVTRDKSYLRPANHKEAGPKFGSLEALLGDMRAERNKYRKQAEESAELVSLLGERVQELEKLDSKGT